MTLFSLLFWVVYGLIILAHSWGFWHVYKSKIGGQVFLEMFFRGIAAGLAGWFWLCFGLGIWNLKSAAAFMIYLWIYGIWFVPLIGLVLTIIFRQLLKKLQWQMGTVSRAVGGGAVGIILASVIGLTWESFSGQNFVSGMALLLGTMGFGSGIMAGKSNDRRKNKKKLISPKKKKNT